MPRVEIRTIIETWKACGQNNSLAARQLGIGRRTVKRWVERGRQPWGYVRWQGVQRQSTANHGLMTGRCPGPGVASG
ncbi:MAG: hypothetical protein HY672_00675 [Chloroflexi bacterium]|nr:hypothetical protein [Chloroflexota bacterium]